MRTRVGKVSACTHADTGASMSIPPQAFPLGRPGLKDERRRYRSYRSLVAKATPHTPICKRREGLCEGGLRRHTQRSYKTLSKDKSNKALNTLSNICEEETDAGERIPSSPQTVVLPEHALASAECEEKQDT